VEQHRSEPQSTYSYSGVLDDHLRVSVGVVQSTAIRVEQDDPSVTYTGNLYKKGPLPIGGGATLTNALDARAAIAFIGAGISWIGVRDPWSGFAQVYLDRVLNTVDTYASATTYQRFSSLPEVSFLARTLSIEVIHTRDVTGVDHGSGLTSSTSKTAPA
jgi:hypothetical protein